MDRPQILALLPGDFDLEQFECNLIIFSSEVHLEKPNPKIFQLAVKKAGMKSDECLFCTEEHDHILAATHVGMQTFEVQKPPKRDIGQLTGKLVKGLLPAGN
ncbi:MAG TPA: HAD hydrolase-like protein [Pyrinomonadaceae bacterium]|nr:HAD hydrolase-like protein [Pyrinomonadaceae bacterium]